MIFGTVQTFNLNNMSRPKKEKTSLEKLQIIKSLLFENSVSKEDLQDFGVVFAKDGKIDHIKAKTAKGTTKTTEETEESAQAKLKELSKVFSGSEMISLDDLKAQNYIINIKDGKIQSIEIK